LTRDLRIASLCGEHLFLFLSQMRRMCLNCKMWRLSWLHKYDYMIMQMWQYSRAQMLFEGLVSRD
jgi:hypothetical protein